ncbi:uncharacterized protein LOC117328865 [Pecten maximus]|uniref:uncharacterized protein LOC117328865 n=1 Tax=Pecten maximus TaxID=6579 RepID=UPI00145844BB|nr:uncharacterized protein LOC117328865 [Pecten maximus]
MKSIFSRCHRSSTIQVKNCCSYRVYYLHSATLCPSSYCVSPFNISTEGCSDSTLLPTTIPSSVGTHTTNTISSTHPTTANGATTPITTTGKLSIPTTTVATPSSENLSTPDIASDPCLTYEELQVDYRRSPDHIEDVYEEGLCDILISEKWYRFMGIAGGDLTNNSESVEHHGCGTYYPLWMDGQIPDVAEGIVHRNVCMKSIFSRCHRSSTIQVKNCCSYRVYYLHSATLCPSSYCVSPFNISTEGCSDSPLLPTTISSSVGTHTTNTISSTHPTTANGATTPITTTGKLSIPTTTVATPSSENLTTPDIASDPCLTYEELQVDYRRSPDHIEDVYEEGLCDILIREKWYRFMGIAGGDLTNNSESVEHHGCGTYYPLWMDGQIPDVAEGIVHRNVCMKSIFSRCHRSSTIQVKNCCSYRVYYLHSATLCPSSYCVSPFNISTEGCSDSPLLPTTISSSVGTHTTNTISSTHPTTANGATTPITTTGKLSIPTTTVATPSSENLTTPDIASDPCLTYEELQVDYRRSPDHIEDVYEEGLCDILIREKWYRFVGEAGGDLTNNSESVEHHGCGTYYPLWMDGQIPDVAEGIVHRNVCMKSIFSRCHRSSTIQVKNCCSYRVYYLHSATLCPSSYCVSPYNISTEGCSDSPLLTTTISSSVGTHTTNTISSTHPTTANGTTTPITTTGKLSIPTTTVATPSSENLTTPDIASDPCLTYEELQVDYRRSPGHIDVYEKGLCDILIREKWYRFVGEAGGDLTNNSESVEPRGCGTYYPLWMDGQIPDVAEGTVHRNVCMKSIFSRCHRSSKIQVKNCCSYRVYYLHSATLCPSSYCVSPFNISTEGCSDSPFLPTRLSPTHTTDQTSPTQPTTITNTLSRSETPRTVDTDLESGIHKTGLENIYLILLVLGSVGLAMGTTFLIKSIKTNCRSGIYRL